VKFRIHARPAFPHRFPANSPQVLLALNAQILPLCFDNDRNCSPRKPLALITIQIALPCTPSPIPPYLFSITYELPQETREMKKRQRPPASPVSPGQAPRRSGQAEGGRYNGGKNRPPRRFHPGQAQGGATTAGATARSVLRHYKGREADGIRNEYRVGVRKLQHGPYRQSWLRRSNLRRSRRFLRHVAPLLTLAVRAANASPATKTESGRKKYLCEI